MFLGGDFGIAPFCRPAYRGAHTYSDDTTERCHLALPIIGWDHVHFAEILTRICTVCFCYQTALGLFISSSSWTVLPNSNKSGRHRVIEQLTLASPSRLRQTCHTRLARGLVLWGESQQYRYILSPYHEVCAESGAVRNFQTFSACCLSKE